MAKRPPSLTARSKTAQPRKWAATSRLSRAARGYGWEWEKQRERVLKRDKRLCQVCLKAQRVTLATDVDHIVSRAQGGSEDDSNLQSLCRPCHKAKTAKEGRAAR